MRNKVATAMTIFVLLASMLTLTFNIQPVKATLYITSDYTFTEDIYEPIVVLADNIVIDGNGYTLQRTVSGYYGIDLTGRSNVTVKNLTIIQFYCSIYLYDSSNNNIFGNNIIGRGYNSYGFQLWYGSNNNVSSNYITNCEDGIFISTSRYNDIIGNTIINTASTGVRLVYSYYNTVSGNNITDGGYGVRLIYSSINTLSGNNITNQYGIGVSMHRSLNNYIVGNNITDNTNGFSIHSGSNNNLIFHNNFINNWYTGSISSSDSIWDDGYPSGGNYWSKYAGTDADGDGIGDVPYIIDANNEDRYPLMEPWSV